MKDVWNEREKAFENQYFRDVERKQIEAMKDKMHESQIRELCGKSLSQMW